MRLTKKLFLFATEFVFLFVGSVVLLGYSAYLHDEGLRFGTVVFIVGFSLVCAGWFWFRRKTGKWTTAEDAEAFIALRYWRRLHPRRAKYFRTVRRSFIWLPSICAAFALFFLPVASHIFYFGSQLISHYRISAPLNWLVIKNGGIVWVFFSEAGASRYGLTPVWFNDRMPSNAVFLIRDPEHGDSWHLPENEPATTRMGVKDFRLGMITARCYEYRHVYGNLPESSSLVLTPPVLWESLCSTHPNGIDYNLRTAFLGNREDLPGFYKVLNSAIANPD